MLLLGGALSLLGVSCGGDLPVAGPAELSEETGNGGNDGDGGNDALSSTQSTTGSGVSATSEPGTSGAGSTPTGDAVPVTSFDVTVDSASSGTFDRRLLGTNVPAWLARDRFMSRGFQNELLASGATIVRMPGGSWSNTYRWLACEQQSQADGCFYVTSARPTDFIDLLQAVDLPGMWTVSMLDTAQSAAALVAFFNGDPGDNRVIGVDRDGVDWKTVGEWASLRAEHGNPDPYRITLWEIGNEVYGGRPEVGGTDCDTFGWEDVWTCDGAEYMVGDDAHDGFIDDS